MAKRSSSWTASTRCRTRGGAIRDSIADYFGTFKKAQFVVTSRPAAGAVRAVAGGLAADGACRYRGVCRAVARGAGGEAEGGGGPARRRPAHRRDPDLGRAATARGN